MELQWPDLTPTAEAQRPSEPSASSVASMRPNDGVPAEIAVFQKPIGDRPSPEWSSTKIALVGTSASIALATAVGVGSYFLGKSQASPVVVSSEDVLKDIGEIRIPSGRLAELEALMREEERSAFLASNGDAVRRMRSTLSEARSYREWMREERNWSSIPQLIRSHGDWQASERPDVRKRIWLDILDEMIQVLSLHTSTLSSVLADQCPRLQYALEQPDTLLLLPTAGEDGSVSFCLVGTHTRTQTTSNVCLFTFPCEMMQNRTAFYATNASMLLLKQCCFVLPSHWTLLCDALLSTNAHPSDLLDAIESLRRRARSACVPNTKHFREHVRASGQPIAWLLGSELLARTWHDFSQRMQHSADRSVLLSPGDIRNALADDLCTRVWAVAEDETPAALQPLLDFDVWTLARSYQLPLSEHDDDSALDASDLVVTVYTAYCRSTGDCVGAMWELALGQDAPVAWPLTPSLAVLHLLHTLAMEPLHPERDLSEDAAVLDELNTTLLLLLQHPERASMMSQADLAALQHVVATLLTQACLVAGKAAEQMPTPAAPADPTASSFSSSSSSAPPPPEHESSTTTASLMQMLATIRRLLSS